MTKRRVKSTPKPRDVFEWGLEETAAILAYIDHCIRLDKGRKFTESTLVDHLKHIWTRDYTWARIENRLKVVHRRGHKPENKSRGDILSKGTACLELENLALYFLPTELTLEAIRLAEAELNTLLTSNDKRQTEIVATRVSERLSATAGYLESRCSVTSSPVVRGSSQRTSIVRDTNTRSPDVEQQLLLTPTKRKPVVRCISSHTHLNLRCMITQNLGTSKLRCAKVQPAKLRASNYHS
jgi:hypothetical protein